MDNTNFASRKLWTTWITMGLIILSAMLSLFAKPENVLAFASLYPTMVGGLLALNGIYQASNVATKWVNGEVEVKNNSTDPKPSPPKPE